jgi:hypothetical protein
MTPIDFLRRFSVPCVYHFTDERNIPLIRQNGGLLSLAELRRRGVEPPATGGNDWSHEADAHSYDQLAASGAADERSGVMAALPGRCKAGQAIGHLRERVDPFDLNDVMRLPIDDCRDVAAR